MDILLNIFKKTKKTQLGGRMYPLVMLVCNNCWYIARGIFGLME